MGGDPNAPPNDLNSCGDSIGESFEKRVCVKEPNPCRPPVYKKCRPWGDPHVVTFDGTQVDVYGVATYILAQPTSVAIANGGTQVFAFLLILKYFPFEISLFI